MNKPRFVSAQTRLNLVFTLLFLVGAIILTGFIQASIQAMSYNTQARLTFTEARQLYQAQAYLQDFEKAFNDYELTSDYVSLSEYQSNYARLQQSLANMAAETELLEEKAALDKLALDIAALRQRFDQVIQAVDREDWEAVVGLDDEAYALVEPIFSQFDRLIQARSDALLDQRDEAGAFTDLVWLAILLALPVFLVVVVVVVLIVARQIHTPLIRLTDELVPIQQDDFDPAALAPLPERRDEIGYLAREYLQMAAAVLQRRAGLQREADDIRARLR